MSWIKKMQSLSKRQRFMFNFILNGLLFASLMALYEFYQEKTVSVGLFVFRFISQGLVMGFVLTFLLQPYRKK